MPILELLPSGYGRPPCKLTSLILLWLEEGGYTSSFNTIYGGFDVIWVEPCKRLLVYLRPSLRGGYRLEVGFGFGDRFSPADPEFFSDLAAHLEFG